MSTFSISPEAKPTVVALAIVGLVITVSGAMIVDKTSRQRTDGPPTGSDAKRRPAGRSDETTTPVPCESSSESRRLPPAPDEHASNDERASNSGSKTPGRNKNYSLPSIETIVTLPKTEAEIAAAFGRAAPLSCKIVPPGNPLELSGFTPFVTGVHTDWPGNQLPPPSLRRHAFSVGLDVASNDQRALPKLSGNLILSYLRDHFVSIQVRIAKDPLTGGLYLYPELLAAMAKFQGVLMTENMEQAVAESVRNFRCLGLLISPGEQPRPETLRTLVLVQKYLLAGSESGTPSRPRPMYELVLIRGRERNGQLELHPFVTSGGRRVLHYLGNSRKPHRSTDCDIQAMVYFSDYSHGSMYPVKGVVRSSKVKSRSRFPLARLEASVRQRQLQGDVWDNVADMLDSIIDGRLAR